MSLVKVTVADEGHHVRTASNGVDGRTCYRRFREARVTSPVPVLFAYGVKQARRELGAEAAMDKPVDPEGLLGRLERLAAR